MTSRRIAITGKSGETSIYSVPVAWAGKRYRTLTAAIQATPKEHHQRLMAAAKQQLLAAVMRTLPSGGVMPDGMPLRTVRQAKREREAERYVPDPVLVELGQRMAFQDVDLDALTGW